MLLLCGNGKSSFEILNVEDFYDVFWYVLCLLLIKLFYNKKCYVVISRSGDRSRVGASVQSAARRVSPTTRYCRRYARRRALPSYPRLQDSRAARPSLRTTVRPRGASGNSGKKVIELVSLQENLAR